MLVVKEAGGQGQDHAKVVTAPTAGEPVGSSSAAPALLPALARTVVDTVVRWCAGDTPSPCRSLTVVSSALEAIDVGLTCPGRRSRRKRSRGVRLSQTAPRPAVRMESCTWTSQSLRHRRSTHPQGSCGRHRRRNPCRPSMTHSVERRRGAVAAGGRGQRLRERVRNYRGSDRDQAEWGAFSCADDAVRCILCGDIFIRCRYIEHGSYAL